MPLPPVPLSAKNAVIRINGHILFGMKWVVTPESAMLDTSNFDGGGYEDQIAGLKKVDIHAEGWWNSVDSLYDNPLNLQDGAVVSYAFYTNGVGSPNWSGTALVKGSPMTSDVHGRVDFSMDAKGKGYYSTPTLTTTTSTTTTTT